MKKSVTAIFFLITICFICFGIGVFVGRSSAQGMPKMESYDYGETKPNKVDTLFDQPEFIDGKLNINVARLENLCLLPGIGEGLAQEIIRYRQQNGPFTSVDELRNVEGLGESRLSNIRDLVTIGE